jgi:uncharacterized protein YjdB
LPAAVATVAVSSSATTIQVGMTTQATAAARDSRGNVLSDRSVAWASSDASIANVSATGIVSAVAPGTVTISANVEGVSGTVAVVVIPVPVATTQVSLASSSVIAGQSTQATATARDGAGNVLSGRTVAWSIATHAMPLAG